MVQIDSGAALVLLYDHLLGQGVKAHGKVERLVLSHSEIFKTQERELLAENPGAASLSDLLPRRYQRRVDQEQSQEQRYIRCNTLLTTTDEVVRQLHHPPACWNTRHQHHIASTDIHRELAMADVLAVPAGVIVHDHPLVTTGQVVIQVLRQVNLLFPLKDSTCNAVWQQLSSVCALVCTSATSAAASCHVEQSSLVPTVRSSDSCESVGTVVVHASPCPITTGRVDSPGLLRCSGEQNHPSCSHDWDERESDSMRKGPETL